MDQELRAKQDHELAKKPEPKISAKQDRVFKENAFQKVLPERFSRQRIGPQTRLSRPPQNRIYVRCWRGGKSKNENFPGKESRRRSEKNSGS